MTLSSTAPAGITNPQYGANDSGVYVNYIRNPQDPFVGNASLYVYNYNLFTNTGAGVEWIPFDSLFPFPTTGYHSLVTMVDPTTGLSRLLLGNDQGVWSFLDDNGTFETTVGSTVTGPGLYPDNLPNIDRNGDLQITQFYYGASQPSNAAALMSQSMSLYYGAAAENGAPSSDGAIISDGNIVWGGPSGTAGSVATDPTGSGTVYQYWWPCCNSIGTTDFFQVNGTSKENGLLQASGGQPTPDPQWPISGPTTGANFAVNPVNGDDIVISSNAGRIFTTTNGGVTWFDVGEPAVFGSPGAFSTALAYGAPDPGAPEGVGDLANFIYVGTRAGQIYVTQDGGGSAQAITGSTSRWASMARPSSRSSPTPRAAATTPTRSPPPACSTSPTRSSWATARARPLSSGSTSPTTSSSSPITFSARPTTRRPT